MYFEELNPRKSFFSSHLFFKDGRGFQKGRKQFPPFTLASQNQGDQLISKAPIQTNEKVSKWRPVLTFYRYLYHFLDTSSIHGLSHLTALSRHCIEYLLWLLCLAACLAGCVYIGLSSWHHYQNDPTVISMERNYKEWNTTLPSITICPVKKIDETKLQEVVQKLKTVDKEKSATFLSQLMENGNYDDLDLITVEDNEIDSEEYMKLLLSFKFEFTHSRSQYIPMVNGSLLPVITEMGICYTYNSQASYLQAAYNFFNGSRHLVDNYPIPPILGSPLDGDMIAKILGMNSGYLAIITNSKEVPDSATRYEDLSEEKERVDLLFKTLITVSSEDLKDLSIRQRKCRYADESNLTSSDVYSYNLCRVQCRMDLAKKLCGCIPHFYRKIGKNKVCNFSGLKCLQKHNDMVARLHDHVTNSKVSCGCLPPCDDANYIVDDVSSTTWDTDLKFGIISYPKFRLRREIIFGFSDLLVSIGGTAGLFLGCSVLSFIEIFYFLTLRLLLYVWHQSRTTKILMTTIYI